MKRCFNNIVVLGFLALALGATQPICEKAKPKITTGDNYINYDVHVNLKGKANVFFISMETIDHSDVVHLIFNPMESNTSLESSHKSKSLVVDGLIKFYWPRHPSGTDVLWKLKTPVDYCNTLHFGLLYKTYDKNGNFIKPKPIGAAWGYVKSPALPVAVIPFPMQVFEIVEDTTILATVYNPAPQFDTLPEELKNVPDTRSDIVIERSWAFSKKVYTLDELLWNNPELSKLDWHKQNVETVPKNDSALLPITGFDTKKYKSVLVKYWVRRAGEEEDLFHFVNQAEISAVK